ncbi:hypothetical protein Tco_0692876 [Tanacetum coccineum]
MENENLIRTLGDYFRPSHEGYRNTIELPDGNNVVPLRWLVQNGCSFHELQSEDPNQHLKDFLKLVDSLDLDVTNRERLEHLPTGSISTWEDLTTRESFSEAWTHFKDLLQKVPHHGIDLWIQVQIFYDLVNPATRRTINQSAGGKLRDKNAKESWALLEDLALYDNESWNDPRDFAKPVKAISLPQDVPSTSDRRLIELENQVQRLMEAHLAPKPPVQVNKIASSCEISGGKWFTFKPEQNNLGDTYNPSWKSHPNLRWRQPQNSQNNFSNPPNRFQSSVSNRPFNNNPQNFNNQLNLKGLVSTFMASQDARLSKFESNFEQQQSKMANKIDTFLKAINDRMTGALPSDTVKNPKLNVNSSSSVFYARSYPMEDPQSSSHPLNSINAIKTCSKQTNDFQKDQPKVKTLTVNEIGTPKSKEPKQTLKDEFKDLHLNLPVLEVLAHAPMYNAILDKYVESLWL